MWIAKLSLEALVGGQLQEGQQSLLACLLAATLGVFLPYVSGHSQGQHPMDCPMHLLKLVVFHNQG